jgi:hypothetical protein
MLYWLGGKERTSPNVASKNRRSENRVFSEACHGRLPILGMPDSNHLEATYATASFQENVRKESAVND